MLGTGMKKSTKYKLQESLLSKTRFPEKLHRAACDEEIEFIFWSPSGDSVFVHSQEFERRVMQECPGLVKIPSFKNLRRQFRVYSFSIQLCLRPWYHKIDPGLFSYIISRWPDIIDKEYIYEMQHTHFLRDNLQQLPNVKSTATLRKELQLQVESGSLVQVGSAISCTARQQDEQETKMEESRKRKYMASIQDNNGSCTHKDSNSKIIYESITPPTPPEFANPFDGYVNPVIASKTHDIYGGNYQFNKDPTLCQQWECNFGIAKQDNNNYDNIEQQIELQPSNIRHRLPIRLPPPPPPQRSCTPVTSTVPTIDVAAFNDIGPIAWQQSVVPYIPSQIPPLFPSISQCTPCNVPHWPHCPHSNVGGYSPQQTVPTSTTFHQSEIEPNWRQEMALDFSVNMNPLSSSTPVKINRSNIDPVLNNKRYYEKEVDQEVPKIYDDLNIIGVDENNNKELMNQNHIAVPYFTFQ